jgi:hypothetical protein
LTPYHEPRFVSGQAFQVKLRRDGNTLAGWVDGRKLGSVTISDPTQKAMFAEPQRFKFYGWQGGLYSLQDAVLVDGPEEP